MRKGKFVLFTAWAVAIILLVIITFFNQAKVDKFMGLTASKEHSINFSYPVQLKEAFVIPGQKVEKGELLAKLVRSDLVSKINAINSKIAVLNAEKLTTTNEINRQLETLKIKYLADMDRLGLQITQSELKLKTNKKLLQTIMDTDNKSFTTIEHKIKSLKQEKQSIQSLYKTNNKHLKQQLENINIPFETQINELLEEKNILSQEEDELTIYAPMNGKIGSISHSKNSQIESFEPLLTIYSKYPESVTGYIHEDILNELKVGQVVAITSFNKTDHSKNLVYGTIENIENRIEEIPLKLKKYKIVPLWGYKVSISLPENSLQVGKKVMIISNIEKNSFELKIESLLKFLNLN